MAKYMKKPVVIEAFQIYPGKNISDCPLWFLDAMDSGVAKMNDDFTFTIKTLEGNHLASVGDFIIQGVKGELYPCKPDIFEMTYQAVKEVE